MAVIPIYHPEWCGQSGGQTPSIGEGYEKTGQTFVKGNFLQMSSGQMQIAPDAATKLAGIALEDAKGTANLRDLFAKAKAGARFCINVMRTGDVSLAVTAIAMIGVSYGIVINSGKHMLDKANTTQLVFKVVALDTRDAIGDQYGRVIVEVLPSAYDFSS